MLPPNVIPVGKKNFEYDGGKIRFGAQVQTDAVVDSILKELSDDPNKYGDRTENVPVEDENGNTVPVETSVETQVSDKEIEKKAEDKSGILGKSVIDTVKSDKADKPGGEKGDGGGPKNTDNLDDLTQEGPCSK